MRSLGGVVGLTLARRGEHAVVEISDRGPAVPAEHLPYLTDRFYRVDGSRARDSGGRGLGLSIARAITEAHGGTLELASREGQGTTVRVALPAAGAANATTRTHEGHVHAR